ncbi:MAG: hypothetical protein AAFY56_21585 [Pseudomonadota bacterium]
MTQENDRLSARRMLGIAFASLLLLSVAACGDAEDAAEETGDAVGDAVEGAGDAVEDATD